jgi:alanine dehydrogenase
MLILNNRDLESVLDMKTCINALYDGLRAYSRGDAARRPRIDLFTPTSRPDEVACFSSMEGIVKNGYYAIRIKPDIKSWIDFDGYKRNISYCVEPGRYGGLILLYRTENAELVAIMNDGYVQHMRVGATAALGAKYLARTDATTVGIFGSGGMARSFAQGFSAVRNIKKYKVFSPNRNHLNTYCTEMSSKLRVEFIPMDNAEQVVKDADIVASCTDSMKPVIDGRWLEPGMYAANVSGREVGQDFYDRISLVGYLTFKEDPLKIDAFSDDNFEIRMKVMAYVSGQPDERERIPRLSERRIFMPGCRWVPCVDWQSETGVGRTRDEDITLLAELSGSNFQGGLSSSGIQGLQFASVAGAAYELASRQNIGQRLDTQLFLQDVRT